MTGLLLTLLLAAGLAGCVNSQRLSSPGARPEYQRTVPPPGWGDFTREKEDRLAR
jgi:hypothetical protein